MWLSRSAWIACVRAWVLPPVLKEQTNKQNTKEEINNRKKYGKSPNT
jgi:hypothetical protein